MNHYKHSSSLLLLIHTYDNCYVHNQYFCDTLCFRQLTKTFIDVVSNLCELSLYQKRFNFVALNTDLIILNSLQAFRNI
jgi:hypothetical protein